MFLFISISETTRIKQCTELKNGFVRRQSWGGNVYLKKGVLGVLF